MSKKDDYFARSESWAVSDRVKTARSLRAAWIITGLVFVIAVFEGLALVLLVPLKTVQPVTLLVDRQTGYVQALDPLAPRPLAADTALTRSLIAQYTLAREGFDRATVATDYRKVALWSADRARSGYLSTMPATNPASPFQRYPAGTIVRVHVKSVTQLSATVALVRFDTWLEDRSGRAGTPQPWISRVRYRFANAAMSFDDRLINPLGLQVLSYIRDAESPEPSPPPMRPMPAATVPVLLEPTPQPQLYRSTPIAPQSRVQRTRPNAIPSSVVTMVPSREVPSNQIPLGSPLVGKPR